MEESAAYSSNPNLSPKSEYRRSSSRFKLEGGNSMHGAISSQHDQSTSNGPNTEDYLSSSRLKRSASLLSTRSLAMSDSEQSEIISPIPRKHTSITTKESLQLLRIETPSPAPSNRSALSNYSVMNTGPNHMHPSLVSPSIRSQNHIPSITKRSKKYSSIESLAERTRGGASSRTGHSSALARHAADRYARERGEWEGGFARRWIRWMHKGGIKHWIVPCMLLAATWIKWAVGLGSYSGRDTPPMFGDYEAQRHWMEITIHLPFQRWYTYDLQYWGLDYPPLTAYVSWLCGKVGSWIEPSWFALGASRGIETDGSKVYMRATVIICDLLYVWAVIVFTRTIQGTRSIRTQNLTMVILLMQPALLLIDFGHFQYNSVMLALTLLSVNYMSKGQDLVAAVFFVASLGFKQMSLYYAPAIGSYLLAKCVYLGQKNGGRLFVQLGAVTVASFALLFLPFLPPFASPTAIIDPIARIFPFSRGLFEDKVANFWCFSNVALKWRNIASPGTLVKISTVLTAIGFVPAVAGLLRTGFRLRIKEDPVPPTASGVSIENEVSTAAGTTPSTRVEGDQENETSTGGSGPFFPLLLISMLTSSISFFLFSFQVHEKTILVPLLPLTLIMVGASGRVESTTWELGMLANNVAVFSMWPLLKRDGLGIQYVALTVLWNAALGYTPFKHPKTIMQSISLVVSIACIVLHSLEFVIQPPARYPDLFPVLNVLISTPVFGLVWLWSIKSGIEVGWAIVGLGSGNPVAATPNTNSQPTPSSLTANLRNVASLKIPHSHSIRRGDPGSPFSAVDSPLSPLSPFNRGIGFPPATLGQHRPEAVERSWSGSSANSNTRTRGNLPVGPGWDRPLNSGRAEGTEDGGGEAAIQGLGLNLNLDGQGEDPSSGHRTRVQSLGASNVRKRVLNFPENMDGLPPSSD